MLSQFLTTEIFAFLLIFLRVGAAVMLMPGFGEVYISPRFRLVLALLLSLVLVPMLAARLPDMPVSVAALIGLMLAETSMGILIGSIGRLLLSGVQIAAAVIATQSSLASALVTDVMQQGQTTAMTNFLSATVLAAIFAADLHHVMIQGLVASYDLLTPGAFPIMEDVASLVVNTVAHATIIAVQISAPHLVVGTLMFVAAGILGKLMPNIQVFFLIIPVQLFVGLTILLWVITSIVLFFLADFRDAVSGVLF